MKAEPTILISQNSDAYELLDSGDGEKLERFGMVVLRRPDPQVLWEKHLSGALWQEANAHFDKQWIGRKKVPESWNLTIDNLSFALKLSAFKHVGLFPEQRENWTWITKTVSRAPHPVSVLNLFGYTGGSTLAALAGGASVVHVDGSKTAIGWAKENAALSGLADKPVRWILDDALAFVKREIKRGNHYDAVIMDPPAFGHGPEGEVWEIEEHLPELVRLLPELLASQALFVLINGYASGYSPLSYHNLLLSLSKKSGGGIVSGELALQESGSSRLLPAGIFARWQGNGAV